MKGSGPTPSRIRRVDSAKMRASLKSFLNSSGVDLEQGDLARTPGRAARAWKDHLLAGYKTSPEKILIPLRSARSRELVAVRGIDFISTCIHHLMPFHGKVHLAYLPAGKIVGVSRLSSLVRCLSRRLQIQEELASQIALSLDENLESEGAACVIEATHLCMTARDDHSAGSIVTTAAFAGCYATSESRKSGILSLLSRPVSGSIRSPRRRR
jgi:GTP cyclohydrolase I